MVRALASVALPPTDPARFVRIGAGLLAHPPELPTLVVAPLSGDALLLGRHQRLAGALEVDKLGERVVLRRSSGGRTISAGKGTLGVLLALPVMDALLDAPIAPAKLINRHVRGLLSAMSRFGARYFGRDFISVQQQQLAIVGQDNGPRAALFEAFVAIDRKLEVPDALIGYPPHGDPRAKGPPHATLGAPLEPEAIARAYAQVHQAELRTLDAPLPEAELPSAREDEAGWLHSGFADIPIGFLEAMLQRDGDRVRAARLRGDFLAPGFVIEGLERALAGVPLESRALGERVDAAFHQPGAFLLGTLELRLLADALLAAAAG